MTLAILLLIACLALAMRGAYRISNTLAEIGGHRRRLYDFYHVATGRNWMIDMDRDMSKDADVQWQRYVREVQAQQVNLRG